MDIAILEEYDRHDQVLVQRLNARKDRMAEAFRALERTGKPIPLVEQPEKKPLCTVCQGAGTSEFCENCGKK